MKYNFLEIEKKWQKYWRDNKTFQVSISEKPKYYILDMFPYPSGAGLHVGHPLGYIASDIFSRYKRHKGFNVLHPQGYDSFGLPAEQYAIKTGQHPKKTTQENIDMYRRQLDRIGFSFDWSREIRTSDPNYYKWTQWIFTLMFNSFYCKIENKAKHINELISSFENNGDDIYKNDLEDNKVDLIYNCGTFEYFDLQEAPKVLKEWYRVLKPGGTLRISVPNFESVVKVYLNNGKDILGEGILGLIYPYYFFTISIKSSSSLFDSFLIDLTFMFNLLSSSNKLLIDFSLFTAAIKVKGSSNLKE